MNEVEVKAIGQRIRQARKSKGVTQTQLAEMLGKALRTVQKYEKGEIEPSIGTINDIARKLGSTSTYLFGYKSEEVRIDSIADVLGFLFQLEKKNGLNFSIDVKRPPYSDGWQCSIVFDGNERSAESNGSMCLFLEDWRDRRGDNAEFRIDNEKYAEWQDKTLAYYSMAAIDTQD